SNEPRIAFTAYLNWKRTVHDCGKGLELEDLMHSDCADLAHEVDTLARLEFGNSSSHKSWSGARLAAAFARTRYAINRKARPHHARDALPALNPPRMESNMV
ncbi:MAG: hypothetical protein ACR2PZ_08990, partial [Pseudomonadales bacterium]